MLFIVAFSCASLLKAQNVGIPELDLNFNSKETALSEEAENYIESVVSIMKKDALHRQELNFDEIHEAIRFFANGAETIEDTHLAIKKALPLLKDHHSYFMTSAEIKKDLGLTEQAIMEIKNGKAPHLDKSKLVGLKTELKYANGKIVDGDVGYVSVPSFDNLYIEEMTMFADSLQIMIKQLDKQKLRGWIVDLRDNSGGSAMPMIAGLGPLLDDDNAYFTVDREGKTMSRAYYKNGGYYDTEKGEDEAEPLVRSTINYKVGNPNLPVTILTSFKTASSAEAVTAIFAGQPNVKVIGSKTNGLTSTNSFNFLEDNSALNITIGYYANRHHQMYKQGIDPDVEVKNGCNPTGNGNMEKDIVLQNALLWIK